MGRKRKGGEGTVRLRGDGRWEGRVVIGYDEKNYPKTKSVFGKTKAECMDKLKKLKKQLGPTKSVLLYVSTLQLSSDTPEEGVRSHYRWL